MSRSCLLRPAWLFLLIPALLTGCASVGSRTWNLEQLHADDSSYRYTGALMGDLEYTIRQQLLGPSALFRTGLTRKEPKPIENPGMETLDALIGLMELDPADRHARARQIQWFARLGVEDPSALCRERAFLGLAQAARALAPLEPQTGPRPGEACGELALATALSELVRSARAVANAEPGMRSFPTLAAELEAACELVRTRQLDLGGARRALELSISLADSVGFDNPRTQPLSALVDQLERLTTARALARGLTDDSGLVLGAALQATIELYGAHVLPGVLNQMRADTDPQVVRAVLEGLERHGLQRQVPGGPGPAELLRQQEDALVELVLTRTESDLRVAAMRVLSRHSDAGFISLREEDWQRWHAARRSTQGGRP